jgi:hypothetical protein
MDHISAESMNLSPADKGLTDQLESVIARNPGTWRRVPIFLSILLFSSALSAQTITGVTGAVADGANVTINGTSFGAKSDFGGSQTFLNAVWATFTSSLDGGNLSRSDQVNTPLQWTLRTSGNRGEPGGQFARKVNDPAAPEPRLGSLQHVPTGSLSRFYTSFWFKTAAPNVNTSGKFYRQYFNTFDFFLSNGQPGSDEEGFITGFSNRGTATTIYGSTQGAALSPGNTWRRVEVFVCLNGCSPIFPSAADYFELRVNGQRYNRRGSGLPSNHIAVEGSLSNENENWVGAASGAANGHSIDIGMMINDDADDAGNPALSFYDFDDVYIDYAFNRVLLSDSPTCLGIAHAETQIPMAWNATSVTAKINRGSFPSDASLFLYVFNDNNTCNAIGFPVTLGGAGGTTPSKPTNLRVLPGLAGLVPIFGFFRRRRALKQKLQ